MRQNGLLGILFILTSTAVCAQKHDHVWLFGYDNNGSVQPEFGGFALDFKENPPAIYNQDRLLNFNNCCGAMSDSAGNLLFYTNGIALHNYRHELIENGDTLNPGSYWENGQSDGYNNYYGAFALPAPGFPNRYYLFHTALKPPVLDPTDFRRRPFYFTVIDMDANNGAGKVLAKNQIVLDKNITWPAACKHGNGRDWWIVVGEKNKPVQYVFLLSPGGLSAATAQSLGPPFSPAGEWTGKSLFSPDGRYYIRHDGSPHGGLRFFEFDRCSGRLDNLRILPYDSVFVSWYAAFSSDSRFLYLNYWNFVAQLDLQSTDWSAALDLVAVYHFGFCPAPPFTGIFNLVQEAPDGRIYYSTDGGSAKCLNMIQRPLLPGFAADITQGGLELPRWNAGTICPFPNYRLGALTGSGCDTLPAQRPANGVVEIRTIEQSCERPSGEPVYRVLPPIRSTILPADLRQRFYTPDSFYHAVQHAARRNRCAFKIKH